MRHPYVHAIVAFAYHFKLVCDSKVPLDVLMSIHPPRMIQGQVTQQRHTYLSPDPLPNCLQLAGDGRVLPIGLVADKDV